MIKMAASKRIYLPLIFFFVLINVFFFASSKWLLQWSISLPVVIAGNLLLFIVTFLSLFFYQKAMTHSSTAGFLRNTYSGIMIKLFVCMIVVLIYAVSVSGNVNKGGFFACIFLYLIYAMLEMRSLLRWNKERKNA